MTLNKTDVVRTIDNLMLVVIALVGFRLEVIPNEDAFN